MVISILQDPVPPSYLRHSDPYTFDINLGVTIKPEGDTKDHEVCKTNFKVEGILNHPTFLVEIIENPHHIHA